MISELWRGLSTKGKCSLAMGLMAVCQYNVTPVLQMDAIQINDAWLEVEKNLTEGVGLVLYNKSQCP